MNLLLTLNTGSSSVKFRLFGLSDDLPLVAGGKVSGLGGAPLFKVGLAGQAETATPLPPTSTHEVAVLTILEWLKTNLAPQNQITAAAHRIVHGGEKYAAATLIDNEAFHSLQALRALAPLHQPHNLAGVQLLSIHLPDVPQYGCFDTTFHAGLDALHTAFALPEHIRARGVRRYGFHGLSYQWIADTLRREHPALATGRVVAAHLGNGASLCALQNGKSVDTTMGLTALDGLPMGTRCGALDPGAVLFIQKEFGYAADDMEKMLYEESGLKGLSGLSNDVKTLSDDGGERARFALDYFVHKTAQQVAAMAASMGGMDALVFSGGIGENAVDVREAVVGKLSFLPAFKVLVVPANEERAMAQEVYETLRAR